MNWDVTGAAGELLGSVVVFVMLGYLAIQVLHAWAEACRALSQGRMEANRELLLLEAECSPRCREIPRPDLGMSFDCHRPTRRCRRPATPRSD